MPKKMKKKGAPDVHEKLKGFDISINEFGQLSSSFPVDKINTFLNDQVDDKKLTNREDEEE